LTKNLPINLVLGTVLVSIVLGTAVLSFIWTPHEHALMNISEKFHEPSWIYLLGTDQLGRDVLSQLMAASRNSMIVALVAVLLGGSIGTLLGLLASAVGGWLEDLVMRIADIGFAFPALLFAIMRISRASGNQIWTRDFVLASRAAGIGRFKITFSHILPNILAPIIVQATIEFAVAILAEAALSYLGLGAQPPAPSWGRMLSEAQTLMYLAPQLAIYPGICIVIAVLGFGLLGDGLRDITDPRLARVR